MSQFEMKDSGERLTYESGMMREPSKGKPRYDLIWQPGLKRLAELMAEGAQKYSADNWKMASTKEELARFKESFLRHAYQWLEGDTSEDHVSACVFNIWGAENCVENMRKIRESNG